MEGPATAPGRGGQRGRCGLWARDDRGAGLFFQSAESTRDYVLAAPRAVFWPALLVYKILKHLYG